MTTTDNPDYWSLLGLSPDSNPEQLKRAFRREARKWHPDLNGNDVKAEDRFKLVNEAYAVLSDPRKRQKWEEISEYNRMGNDPFNDGFPDFNQYLDVVLGIEHKTESNQYNESTYEYENEWPVKSSSPPAMPPPESTNCIFSKPTVVVPP